MGREATAIDLVFRGIYRIEKPVYGADNMPVSCVTILDGLKAPGFFEKPDKFLFTKIAEGLQVVCQVLHSITAVLIL